MRLAQPAPMRERARERDENIALRHEGVRETVRVCRDIDLLGHGRTADRGECADLEHMVRPLDVLAIPAVSPPFPRLPPTAAHLD